MYAVSMRLRKSVRQDGPPRRGSAPLPVPSCVMASSDRRYRRGAFLAACLTLALGSSAVATTLVRMSLAQLAQAATVIVRGSVVSQVSRWNAQHTRIFTFTTVAVAESLKGHAASTLTIQQPGGAIGDLHALVPGTVIFHPATQYVLFLEPGPRGRYLPVGMAQGAYRVYSDKAGLARIELPLGPLAIGSKSQIMGASPTLGEFHMAVTRVLSAPITIPSGTVIPVVIDRTAFRGVGRFGLEGHTTMDLFPGPGVVIPAGSPVEGLAQRVGRHWEIFWSNVSIRGQSVRIQATSEQPTDVDLLGRAMTARVR